MSDARRFQDVEFGEELEELVPDVTMPNIHKFTQATHMTFGRFNDHEEARASGLPGAIVPGIMSQGIMAAQIHAWAPNAKIVKLDTIFRAPLIVDSRPRCRGVVTDLREDERIVEIDMTIVNEQDETRVMGTALVELE
jgi:acyl dehydratase